MCQKIVDNCFFAKPEIICSLQYFTHEVHAVVNENEDIAIAYRDQTGGYAMARIENFWSEPFLFTKKKEEPMDLRVAIDSSGNVMATCAATVNETDVIKTVYKPLNQPWQNPTLFSTPDAENCNPSVLPDGKGDFVLIWQQEKRRRSTIFGSTFSTATQTWSDPQRLSSGESCFDYAFTFWTPGKGYIAWTMSPNGYDSVIQVAEIRN